MAKKRKELIADVKYTNRQRQKHFDVYLSIKENQCKGLIKGIWTGSSVVREKLGNNVDRLGSKEKK